MTGSYRTKADDAAGMLVKAAQKFLKKYEADKVNCSLEKIDIVIFESEHVKAYKDALKKLKIPKSKFFVFEAGKQAVATVWEKLKLKKPEGKKEDIVICQTEFQG